MDPPAPPAPPCPENLQEQSQQETAEETDQSQQQKKKKRKKSKKKSTPDAQSGYSSSAQEAIPEHRADRKLATTNEEAKVQLMVVRNRQRLERVAHKASSSSSFISPQPPPVDEDDIPFDDAVDQDMDKVPLTASQAANVWDPHSEE